jgi:O-antigen/teichoic acid export membrane protein
LLFHVRENTVFDTEPFSFATWRLSILVILSGFIGIFIMFTDFGFTTLMVREVSKDQSKLKDYLVNLSLLKVLLGF